MQVSKWGNSLAIRLPSSVVEALGLKEGDDVTVSITDWRDIVIAHKPAPDDVLERLRAFRGRIPADFRFDRNEANAR